jgi:hypothetical protein
LRTISTLLEFGNWKLARMPVPFLAWTLSWHGPAHKKTTKALTPLKVLEPSWPGFRYQQTIRE